MSHVPKEELRREIMELRHVGSQMSNICYNWSQGKAGLTEHECALLRQLAREWDAIGRRENRRAA